MGTLDGKVEMVDGVPYLRHESTDWFEPELCISWWEMPRHAADFDGCDASWSSTGGEHFSVWRNGRHREFHVLKKDSPPDRSERRPVPPPKTRLETRWNRGRWEKRYAKGWR